jgi:hypothetical protein
VRAFVRECHGIDAQLAQEAAGDGAVRPRAVDLISAAIDQRQPAAELKLVALGMAAEIVMVVENEDTGVLAPRAEEIRRREPADAAAHDHQIVAFADIGDLVCLRPEIAVAQAVSGFETADMTPAQPGQCRRIVAGAVLRCRWGRLGGCGRPGEQAAGDTAANGHGDAIEKIAPRDRGIHAQIAIASGLIMAAGHEGTVGLGRD